MASLKRRKISLWVIMGYSLAALVLPLVISCGKSDTSVNQPIYNVPPSKRPTDTTAKAPGTTGGNNPNPSPVGNYIASAPVKFWNRNNITVSGLSIDAGGAAQTLIMLSNCSNVHITNCRLVNSANYAIYLDNCTNVTIDHNFIGNTGFGIFMEYGQTAKINNNQIQNINGIDTQSLGHAIQFDNVSGGGNQINNNQIENVAGVALHPHDIINVHQSNGIVGDSIQVMGNWIRGGQTSLWPTLQSGAAGIVMGDDGGSYQVCRNNIVVNGGRVGIQAQGGIHIMVDHNQIYGTSLPNSLVGLAWGNWSGLPTSDVTYANNWVKWYNFDGSEVDHFENDQFGSVTLIANKWGANISASILPSVIITLK
jgi:hypothetical protein